MASARLAPRLLWGQLVHELRPSRVRVSAVEYKSHLIEAFEDQPGRWFAYLRGLDGRASRAANLTGFGHLRPDIRRTMRSSLPKRRLTRCVTPKAQQGQAWQRRTAPAQLAC